MPKARHRMLLAWSYALSIAAILCYPADMVLRAWGDPTVRHAISGWVLPVTALASFALIPVTWTFYMLQGRLGGRRELVLQALLAPFFLHSCLCVLLLIGWMVTGGL